MCMKNDADIQIFLLNVFCVVSALVNVDLLFGQQLLFNFAIHLMPYHLYIAMCLIQGLFKSFKNTKDIGWLQVKGQSLRVLQVLPLNVFF